MVNVRIGICVPTKVPVFWSLNFAQDFGLFEVRLQMGRADFALERSN
jgi:hypothetical protein